MAHEPYPPRTARQEEIPLHDVTHKVGRTSVEGSLVQGPPGGRGYTREEEFEMGSEDVNRGGG